MRQKELCDLAVTPYGCVMKRCAAVALFLKINVGTPCQQRLGHYIMALIDRIVQGCESALGDSIEVGSAVEKEVDDALMSFVAGQM